MRIALKFAAAALALTTALPASAQGFRERPPEDEVIYFVLPDRFANGSTKNDTGGIKGGPLQHGFDPTSGAFYLGGDLKGLTDRLDYIQGLGATAIWLGPIYRNKPVQSHPGGVSAGYHGYWITDFLDVDPHFGTRAELKTFVDAAHARGMKVYLDIITNHTADVIKYRECDDPAFTGEKVQRCGYRSKGAYPFSRRGGPGGEPINDGFRGDGDRSPENFAQLTRPDFAYTPFVPQGEERVKNPAWLNDLRRYHNRGDTHWIGESATYGDFAGLDDLATEDPVVVQGMIDVFKTWISDFRIDGFRIDTAKHVNPEFWRAFIPAVTEHAKAQGVPNFHVFAEAYYFDVGQLAKMTHEDGYPAVLDFAFQSRVFEVLGKAAGPSRLEDLFLQDAAYARGRDTARTFPTFLGNHDMGRLAWQIRNANPSMPDDELLKRVTLAHAIMMFSRGSPTIYSGDEQGFVGDGNDQGGREPLFATKVPRYLASRPLGTTRTHAEDKFDVAHPLYLAIAGMARVRQGSEALRRGGQVTRLAEDKPGLFVFSRLNRATGEEVVVAVNTATEPRSAAVEVEHDSRAFTGLHGACGPQSAAPGSYAVSVPALDYVVCSSSGPRR